MITVFTWSNGHQLAFEPVGDRVNIQKKWKDEMEFSDVFQSGSTISATGLCDYIGAMVKSWGVAKVEVLE